MLYCWFLVVVLVSSCENYATWTSGTMRGVNCTVAMEYYDAPGAWNISVQAQDSTPTVATSIDAATMTYGTLYAFQLTKATITFTSSGAGTNNVNVSNDPQVLNNTGNGYFGNINVTGYELSNGVDTIGAGNFTINATNDAKGVSIGTNTHIPSATLSRNNTQDLYVWVDVPSGISNGTYVTNSSTQWIVEAYT